MKDKLGKIKKDFNEEISKIKTLEDLVSLENKFLSRKNGSLTLALKSLKELPKEEISVAGQMANEIKNHISEQINLKKNSLSAGDKGFFDPTLPGKENSIGNLHLTTKAIREIAKIFQEIGFQRERYPEVEWD
ncbi:MAG: hypothetical protein AAB791_02225, partial [Patescibacteria group bacterium]